MKKKQAPWIARQKGLSLVEVMVAMVIGLVIMLAIGSTFIVQRQTYSTGTQLARTQENARIAFELLVRDVREAGGNACGSRNISNRFWDSTPSTEYIAPGNQVGREYLNWAAGYIRGYESSQSSFAAPFSAGAPAAGDRAANTDALLIRSATLDQPVAISAHAGSQFTTATPHQLSTGDAALACDPAESVLFEVANATSGSTTLTHHTDGSPSFPDTSGTGAMLARVHSAIWYIGANGRGSLSLYRTLYGGNPQEIAEGVYNMQIQYLTRSAAGLANAYVDATAVADWGASAANQVVAVRIRLDVESTVTADVNGQRLRRENLTHVISLRNMEIIP